MSPTRPAGVAGARVRLLSCSDPHTRLQPGALGWAVLRDDASTLHVKWDDGSTLGLIPGEDHWQYVADDAT